MGRDVIHVKTNSGWKTLTVETSELKWKRFWILMRPLLKSLQTCVSQERGTIAAPKHNVKIRNTEKRFNPMKHNTKTTVDSILTVDFISKWSISFKGGSTENLQLMRVTEWILSKYHRLIQSKKGRGWSFRETTFLVVSKQTERQQIILQNRSPKVMFKKAIVGQGIKAAGG